MKKRRLKAFTGLLISAILLTQALAGPGSGATAAFAGSGSSAAAAFAASVPNTIGNELLACYVAANGLFTMGTTGGNPNMAADKNKALLYGYPDDPRSSFTTIKIDGMNYIFTADGAPAINALGTEAVSVMSIPGVAIEQIITLVSNPITNRNDMFRISYRMTNTSASARSMGARIMLDTSLGDKDAALFRAPGYGDITYERELACNNIPQFWECYDDLTTPNMISIGMLYLEESEKPDKVQFCCWSDINITEWDFAISGMDFLNGADTAVGVYFNPKPCFAGQTRTVSTYYGISDFGRTYNIPPLSIRITAPYQMDADVINGGYLENYFRVGVFIQNVGATDINYVRLRPAIPPQLKLTTGTVPMVTFVNLFAGKSFEYDLYYHAIPQNAAQTVCLSFPFSIESDDADITINMLLFLPKATIDEPDILFNICATAGEGGAVSGGGQYPEGAEVRLIAAPYEGYAFGGWYEGDAIIPGALNEYAFTAERHRTIQARFLPVEVVPKCNVVVTAGDGGAVSGGGEYKRGDIVTVVATPFEGYSFEGWYEDNIKIDDADAIFTFSASGDINLEARFTEDFVEPVYVTIAVEAGKGGNITGGGVYTRGDVVTLKAIPKSEYLFGGWFENGLKINGAGVEYIFIAENDRNLEAGFMYFSIHPPPPSPKPSPSPDRDDSTRSGKGGGGTGGAAVIIDPDKAAAKATAPPKKTDDAGVVKKSPAKKAVKNVSGFIGDIGDTAVPLGSAVSYANELNKLKLLLGTGADENGNPIFELEAPLNRIQSLVLVIRLLGMEEIVMQFEGTNPFDDVPDWAVPYCGCGFEFGIANGTGGGRFEPDNPVSLREFSAFLLRALEYNDVYGDFIFDETISKAVEVGLYSADEAESLGRAPLTRGDAAKLMVRALQAHPDGTGDTTLLDKLVKCGAIDEISAANFINAIIKIET